MKKKASRPPYGLVMVAIVLAGFGLLFGSIGSVLFSADAMENSIFLLAIPFLTMFIAILLVFIFFINVLARVLDYNVSRRVYKTIEAVIMAGIVFGIIGMFQPWVFALFRYGFQVLLISTLSFIVWSHVTPRGDPRMSILGATSAIEPDGPAQDAT